MLVTQKYIFVLERTESLNSGYQNRGST